MFFKGVATLAAASLLAGAVSAADQPFPEDQSFTYPNLPNTWRQAQTGYNNCTTSTDPTVLSSSMCQTMWVNSIQDFCLWGPPTPNSVIGNTEGEEIAYCLLNSHGARLIPNATFTGVHWVTTPNYVQITGVGDFTKLNIQAGDYGGELDPYGATLQGNPIGGLVYSTSLFGNGTSQVHLWTNFISDTQFCMRICDGNRPTAYCNHLYDERGCQWNMPGNYAPGSFDVCAGDSTEPMGVYTVNGQESTYYQPTSGATQTLSVPSPHPQGATSACTTFPTLGNNAVFVATSSSVPSSSSMMSSSMMTAAMSATSVMPVSSGAPAAGAGGAGSGSGASSASTSTSASASARSAATMSEPFFGLNLVTVGTIAASMGVGILALL